MRGIYRIYISATSSLSEIHLLHLYILYLFQKLTVLFHPLINSRLYWFRLIALNILLPHALYTLSNRNSESSYSNRANHFRVVSHPPLGGSPPRGINNLIIRRACTRPSTWPLIINGGRLGEYLKIDAGVAMWMDSASCFTGVNKWVYKRHRLVYQRGLFPEIAAL